MTERELIEGCLKKNSKSQRKLFELYAGKMMTVCRRYAADPTEAEDMLQESFIRIFNHIGQYRFQGSFEGWIRRIVVHTALRILQKKKLRFSEIHEDFDVEQSMTVDGIATLGAEELLKLVSGLPAGYRIVFNLYVLEGYDHNEIAAMLEINAATSRSQLAKARKVLQTQIENLTKLPKRYA
ncbi:MAG TPA: RNA polymerase sigma factor [Puia sp.]|nr:RNA polymerase sigma factor [Puia sp.]